MQVRYKALGAAQTVTGSRHLLEIDDFNVLLDCGLFQGLKALRLRNWEEFPVPAKEIDAVVLSHAHIDHSGYLPKLVKEGFEGPIYCTHATSALLRIMLLDSARLQEEEAEWAAKKGYSRHKDPQPLYTEKDAKAIFPQIHAIDFHEKIAIGPQVDLTFLNAGHILGAAITILHLQGESQEKKIVYSGDLGRKDDPLMMNPEIVEESDILIMESTYGNRDHPEGSTMDTFGKLIHESIRSGVVLIPAFSVGRTQNILFYLKHLMENGSLPKIPVYIDSPMAISVTELYKTFSNVQKLRPAELSEHRSVFDYAQFRYITNRSQSAMLNEIKKEAIIISASGMCTGGRILHHLYHRLPREEDCLILVGFQAEGSRGRDLLEGEKKVKIFGEEVDVKCTVKTMNGMSAHADRKELQEWTSHMLEKPKMTFIVHGEKEENHHLSNWLNETMKFHAVVPHYLETFELFNGI